MACSSADCVLGEARLISSAISSCGEDRALDEAEAAAVFAGRVLQHFGADDVGGHEVGRELDALGVEAQHAAQRVDEQRLGEARHADQKRVSAGEDRDQAFAR